MFDNLEYTVQWDELVQKFNKEKTGKNKGFGQKYLPSYRFCTFWISQKHFIDTDFEHTVWLDSL